MARPNFAHGYNWWTTEEITALARLYPSAPKEVVQTTIKRSWQAMSDAAKKRGIRRIVRAQRIETPINHDFFKTWTSDMAYVLGFWFADGYITRGDRCLYSIGFRSKDHEHLISIRAVLQSRHRIYDKHDGSYELVISSKTLWEDIKLLGGMPAKSLTTTFPSLPEGFLVDFLRGYCDGDGSVTWDKQPSGAQPCIYLVGTHAFLSAATMAISNVTGLPIRRVHQSKTKVPWIRWTGLNAKLLASWLYSDGCLALERKRIMAELFQHWHPRQYKRSFVTKKMQEVFNGILPQSGRAQR